ASDGVLFAGKGALDDRVSDYLASLGLDVCDYERLRERLQSLPPDSLSADFAETPAAVAEWTVVTQVTDPVPQWKARKNPAEQAALREAMLQDGVMWVRFLRRFSERNRGERPMRESDVSALLTRLKSERPGYRGESFETIAAAGDHGAVVHYAVTPETDRVIGDSGLLLIDTGTQYDGATTDMTRTLACGALTDTERRDCTLVMKAHIALATAVFPQGMTGAALDGIARRPLWDAGLDYGHGTGHGVGAMLHVHEDPVRVSWRSQCRFMPGMVTSDEPGLYREGRHGVRLENMLVADVDRETEFGCFLQFNVLTLCPFDLSILIPELLTPEERDWLNGYHRRIKATLKPLLTPDEYDWLNKYAYEI
ncbi:MAG: M24 family metallopeptidase, partial [Paludibacteraceae bacterium]|nr:M24 family metallopeptidase [Paludibacteraceae bacterium]